MGDCDSEQRKQIAWHKTMSVFSLLHKFYAYSMNRIVPRYLRTNPKRLGALLSLRARPMFDNVLGK